MPRKALTPQEAEVREQVFSRGEILTLIFTQEANNPLSHTGAAFSSFTADKDYAIRSVAVAAISREVTTPKLGVAGVSLTDPNGIDLFGAVEQFVGGIIAAVPFRLEAGQVLEFAAAESEKECVYLSKGKTLYPFLRNDSADGASACTITVRLIPVGKQ